MGNVKVQTDKNFRKLKDHVYKQSERPERSLAVFVITYTCQHSATPSLRPGRFTCSNL